MTHLVAVSGSNVAMILGVVVLVARWCRAGPRMTAVVCALALVGFVILVRPSPSVLRAAAMGALGLIALATGRGARRRAGLAAGVVRRCSSTTRRSPPTSASACPSARPPACC